MLTLATWPARDGSLHRGQVLAPAGAPVGSAVRVWVDARGDVTSRPLPASGITSQVMVAGGMVALCLPSIVAILHLIAVRAIDAVRDRRWTAEWAAVEPLWAGRSS